MGELFNRLSRKANIEFHSILFGVVTMFNALYARSIGVKLVGRVNFRGWTSFFRATNSVIQIGKNCVFNSSGYTNHIGLNHRCIITTMDKNARIVIGDGTGMSSTTITSWKSIIIGENVRIGANCTIMDGGYLQEVVNEQTGEISDRREIIETGYLNMILKGGILYVGIILLMMFYAILSRRILYNKKMVTY